MSNIEQYSRQIRALIPPPDTPEEHCEWLKATMEVLADTILEHAGHDREDALVGFGLLVHECGVDRILSGGN